MNLKPRGQSAPADNSTSATAALMATVDSESRPFTDPAAAYPFAERYRASLLGAPAPREGTTR